MTKRLWDNRFGSKGAAGPVRIIDPRSFTKEQLQRMIKDSDVAVTRRKLNPNRDGHEETAKDKA